MQGNSPQPAAELFSIGTELVIGRIYDTNSFWIAEQLAKMGAPPRRITCLPDDPEEIVGALSDAIRRQAKVVIITGGLGPTPDDLTVECVARLAGVAVVEHRTTLDDFKRRRNLTDDSQISPGLRKMAAAPETATVRQNPVGWAPLISLQVGQTAFYLMPGPPREVQAIFETHLSSILGEVFHTASSSSRVLVEMFESEVSPLLQEVMKQYPQTYLKAYVALRTGDGMPVDVVAYGPDPAAAESSREAAIAHLTTLAAAKGKGVRAT